MTHNHIGELGTSYRLCLKKSKSGYTRHINKMCLCVCIYQYQTLLFRFLFLPFLPYPYDLLFINAMTLLVKNRRPSRLFSWISQIARRASDATSINTNNNVVEQCPPSNIVPPRRSTTICCERTPSASPSDTLSTASSIHPKEFLNDDSNNNNNDMSQSYHTRSRSCNETYSRRQNHRQPLYASSENDDDEEDDMDDSDGSTIIGTTLRRPASVFSLPTTSSHPYNANRHSSDPAPPRLRLSCDLELMRLTPPPPSASSKRHTGWPRADRMIIRHELIRLALNG